ncbi:MAG: polyribonucleotide nucleotidyltransferase, partial [Ferruginibacter sp.]
MSFKAKSVTFDIGEGRMVTLETGKLARQADGSVTVRQGNCILLATVVANKEPKEGQSFFPLSVDYQEKFASAGRVPGSFFKREARLNDYEILTSRLIDRALRPLFPEDYLCDVQVLVSLISSDDEILPDSLACLAASAALAVSDIPIQEIISEVRVARVDGKFITNPTRSELAKSDMEFLIAATDKNIMMVEGESNEAQEEDLIKAIEIAHESIKIQVKAQEDLRDAAGFTAKREYTKPYRNEDLKEKIYTYGKEKMHVIAAAGTGKHERSDSFKALHEEIKTFLGEELPDADKKLIGFYTGDLQYDV